MFTEDAGHLFFGAISVPNDSGYVMLVNHGASLKSTTVFEDTLRNLCSSNPYLFWSGIMNVNTATCSYPNLLFTVETTAGDLITSFTTGNIGGADDKWAWFPGYYDVLMPPFPFYGGMFSLPAGVSDVVVKIIVPAYSGCPYIFLVDNILLTPVGPDISIRQMSSPDPMAWVTGSCFQGNSPVVLNGTIGTSYRRFGTPDYVDAFFSNPAVQWQQSVYDGYTWTDIPGETDLHLSHNFLIPDTFMIRLRGSEAESIGHQNCSVVSNIIKVEVDGLPTEFSISSNSPVCTDADLIFDVNGGATYTMSGPNGFSDNSAFPHINNPTHADSGWYYVDVTTFGGCISTDSTYVKIIGPDVKVSGDQQICFGQKAQLSASGGITYLWAPGEGLSADNVSNPLASPAVTTRYQVHVTDTSSCGANAFVTVRLRNTALYANISGPGILCPSDVAVFKDSSSSNAISWNWDFGNGNTSTLKNPAAQYYPSTRTMSYAVKLSVKDSTGCADSTFIMVKSVNNCHIAVASAFTPNNDGRNDFLYPLNAYKATKLLFRVFNRAGQVVFETSDWTRKWNGKTKGNDQPAGVYIWMLSYTDQDTGENFFKKGTTLLMR